MELLGKLAAPALSLPTLNHANDPMGFLGGSVGYRVLKRLAPGGGRSKLDGSAYASRSKLEVLLGPELWETIRGRSVIDFGCGLGGDSIEMARRGAAEIFGLDIQERFLEVARRDAALAGVDDICTFGQTAPKPADVIVSLDSFEHFGDPDAVLRTMHGLLRPGGVVVTAFGPTWYHPLGGHLFSVFPWAHLVFTERALLRWRSDFKDDGATRFREVAGGLNQMTIARFQRVVADSPLRIEQLELVPIRRLHRLHNRLTREFTTAIVRCRLVPR